MLENMANDEMEIDLRTLFYIIKKKIWLIILITLIATVISGLISFYLLIPVYEASTELLVNKSESDIESIYSYTDIQTDLKLINTYSVIIKSPRIIDLVINDYNLDFTTNELIKKIQVKTVADSQVISINVVDTDNSKAVMLANAIADTFKTEIVKIMNVDNVQILTEAKNIDNPIPVKPNKTLNIAIAFILGLMASIGLVFLLEYLDNTIKTEEDIEKLLGYPVLGIISIIDDDRAVKKKRKDTSNNVGHRGEVNEA